MKRTIMSITLITEAPDGNGYFYSSLELPATSTQIQDALHRARWLQNKDNFMVINIDACETLECLVEQVLEPVDVWELNHFIQRVEELPYEELLALEAILDKKINEGIYKEGIPVKDLINHTYRLNEVSVIKGVTTDSEVGQFVIENSLNEDVSAVPEDSVYLLDKEKIGKLQRKTDGGVFARGHYITTSSYRLEEVYKPEQLTTKECTEEDVLLRLRGMISLKNKEQEEFVPYIKWFMGLSEMDQIKVKAIAEAEEYRDFAWLQHVRESLSEYELSYYSDCASSFFKEHLLHNLDARYDAEWVTTLSCETQGRELLEQLGAKLTSFGVISACGVPLYSMVSCKQETGAAQEGVDEAEGMGGVLQCQ